MHATTVTVRPFGSPQAMTLDLAARYQHFQQVPDLRHRRGVRYPLAVLLTIALWARVTGRWGRVTTRSPGLVPVIAAAGHLHAQARTTPSCGASSVTACSITARPAASPGCWPQAARQCFLDIDDRFGLGEAGLQAGVFGSQPAVIALISHSTKAATGLRWQPAVHARRTVTRTPDLHPPAKLRVSREARLALLLCRYRQIAGMP
ncbi:MAG: transposase family protein [Oscillochloris sp.]|nr:transposase family protein [Oscillochloris sp.]